MSEPKRWSKLDELYRDLGEAEFLRTKYASYASGNEVTRKLFIDASNRGVATRSLLITYLDSTAAIYDGYTGPVAEDLT